MRPFWQIGLNSLYQRFLFGSLFLLMWLVVANPVLAQTIPCHVRLVFDTHPQGGQQAEYSLFLQVKNTTPQPVQAVSVLWLDANDTIIGNSDADCRFDGQALGLSQTGQCVAAVQQISQRYLTTLGHSIWTEMVNSELKSFKRIKSCKVIGYRYQKTS